MDPQIDLLGQAVCSLFATVAHGLVGDEHTRDDVLVRGFFKSDICHWLSMALVLYHIKELDVKVFDL